MISVFVFEVWNWSIGVMGKYLESSTQHSNTPVLQHSNTYYQLSDLIFARYKINRGFCRTSNDG
jgi:hypothetical protein